MQAHSEISGNQRITGVCWNKQSQNWKASITVKGKSIYLGSFAEKEQAIAARQAAEANCPEGWGIGQPKKYRSAEEKRRIQREYFKHYLSIPENKEKHNDSSKRWRKANAGYLRKANALKNVLSGAKSRAKTKGIEFNIDESDIIIPKYCPVLGIPIIPFGETDTGKYSPHSASLDRIDPYRGYVKGNVKVISFRANALKRDCTDPKELRDVADYIEANLKRT